MTADSSSHRPRSVPEREITVPVSLTRPDGSLAPEAVGWTRRPLHRTDGIGRGLRGRGRNKRWEYWAVTTPSHIVAVVASDIDYAGVHSLWLLDRATGESVAHDSISLGGGSITLPGTLGQGPTRVRTRTLRIDIEESADGTRIRAVGPRIELDVIAQTPADHECLGVVVPWSERRFQYTVKDVGRPAYGEIRLDGVRHEVSPAESWATLDHGRGRWPYDVKWNWGAGAGRVDGRVMAVQVGGQWTDGTGSVENAVFVDGRMTKVSEELQWSYDPDDWMRPWRITGSTLDLVFTPFHLKRSVTDLKVLVSRTHQCFGHWSGRFVDADGATWEVRDLIGWAEDVHNRW